MSKTEIVTPQVQERREGWVAVVTPKSVVRIFLTTESRREFPIQFGRYNEITTANRLGLDAYGAR